MSTLMSVARDARHDAIRAIRARLGLDGARSSQLRGKIRRRRVRAKDDENVTDFDR